MLAPSPLGSSQRMLQRCCVESRTKPGSLAPKPLLSHPQVLSALPMLCLELHRSPPATAQQRAGRAAWMDDHGHETLMFNPGKWLFLASFLLWPPRPLGAPWAGPPLCFPLTKGSHLEKLVFSFWEGLTLLFMRISRLLRPAHLGTPLWHSVSLGKISGAQLPPRTDRRPSHTMRVLVLFSLLCMLLLCSSIFSVEGRTM